jgi:hypothetical protein
MNNNPSKNAAALCRWTARIVGTLLVLICVSIAVGQGIPNPFTQPARVQVGFLALALIIIGILAGWRWELSGGIMSLLGWCLFLPAVITSPRGMNGFVMALALPGALYVTSALLRRHHQNHQSA